MGPSHGVTSNKRNCTLWSFLAPVFISVLSVFCLYMYLSPTEAQIQDVIPISSLRNTQPACAGTVTNKRIAIIGAGSAGTSTAYYLARAQAAGEIDPCTNLSITIYERNVYIGGRSTTVQPYLSQIDGSEASFPQLSKPDLQSFKASVPDIELGGSIFVKVNTNLLHAARALNLTIQSSSKAPGTSKYSLGIWDGLSFRFVSAEQDSWWFELGKIFYRYGLAPLWTQRAMKDTVGKFLRMYKEPIFPWLNLTAAVENVGLESITDLTGREFIEQKGISAAFAEDIIQASTRVNYAQNLEQIHGLETMVCMAAEGAMSIKGGNWQIFAGMAAASGAEIKPNTSVLSIASVDEAKTGARFALRTSQSKHYTEQEPELSNHLTEPILYDDIVLASPLQYTSVDTSDLSPSLQSSLPKPTSYVKLHVTLFATKHRISPSFFNLKLQDDIPETILTTLPPLSHSSSTIDRKHPGFFSLSTLRNLTHPLTGEREYAYKIFSHAATNETYLSSLFGLSNIPTHPDTAPRTEHENEISWFYPYIWHSYPYLPARRTFDGPVLGEGLWYTSGIESFISTMETSSLSGRNVAALLVREINEQAAGGREKNEYGHGFGHEDV